MEVDIEEDKNEPELTYPYEEVDLLSESSTAPFLREDSDGLLPGLMRRDINSLFGRIASLSRRLCGREMAHALVEKKGKAKDKIMPSKSAPLTQAAIRQMIKENVDTTIAVERARQVNVRNDARGSGPVKVQDSIHVVQGKKVKFAAATLQGPALTWWNAKVVAMDLKIVNQMPWTEMKQLMTAEFCPIEEIQRIEHEFWNLKVKEYNIEAYTQRFNELALTCSIIVEPERVKVDAYIQGLTGNIKGEVTFSKHVNLNEAVRMTHKLMDQKSQARDERILEGKKNKWENFQSGNSSSKSNHRDNSHQTL
nr:hypothetical protein [Tanacetum cinerariifolium]